MNSHEVFIHIHQGCFAGTGAIVRLPQCQWSKPDGYGKISQCITTTKHSKAKTVCIFLGIYCIYISGFKFIPRVMHTVLLCCICCGLVLADFICNKANLRNLIALTELVILFKLNSNHWFFGMCGLKLGKSEGFDSCDRPSNLTQIGLKSPIFRPCDLEIWWMNPKNNKARLLYYIKLCVSFQIHQWIQTGVTVRKRPIWVKFDDFQSRVTLKFDGWPWKTIGHLFYATSSFVHHFVAIGDFKLEIQSRNAQFGSKSMIFRAMWPCNLTYDLEKQ